MSAKYNIFLFLFTVLHSNALAAPFTGALLEAQSLLNKGEYSKAAELFRPYLSRPELSREATLGLLAALRGEEKNEEAMALLSEYLKRAPMDVEALLASADLKLHIGQPDLARRELEKVKVLRPGRDGLDERFAEVAAALGQKKEAVKAFEEIRKKRELSPSYLLLHAKLLVDLENFGAAEAVIHELEGQYASSAEVLLLKARVLLGLKRTQEAEVAFRRAIQAKERDPAFWVAYAEFLQKEKRFPESRKVLESAALLEPSNPEAQIRLAEAIELAGDFTASSATFAKALALSPGNDHAMFGIVRVEEKAGAMDQVGLRLQSWLRSYPEKTWVAISYGRLLLAIGQRDRAFEVINHAIKVSPNAPELPSFLAQVRSAPVDLPAQPASSAERAQDANPQDSEIYVVNEGELLGTISAKLFGTTRHWREIFENNRDKMKNPNDLVTGMKLRIPRVKGKSDKKKGAGLPEVQSNLHSRAPLTYVVKRREMLSTISAKVYGTTKEWRRIFDANRKKLRRPTSVFAGMRLNIPPLPKQETGPIAGADLSPSLLTPALNVNDDVISFRSAAPQKKNESLLVSPESVKLPDLGARPETPEATMPELPMLSRPDSGVHFSLSGAPLREGIELNAGGFSATLPAKLGYQLGAGIGYQLESSPIAFDGRFQFSRTKFDGLTGFVPASITVERKRFELVSSFSSGLDGLRFELGYCFAWRSAAETSPRVMVTNRSSNGLVVGAMQEYGLGSVYRGQTGIELYLPHREKEEAALTGFHTSTFSGMLITEISRRIGASSAIALGIAVRYEQANFQGTGSRGSTDARDTDLLVSIPFGLRF